MKSVLLFGYYGYANFGDDLILETLAETLARRYRVGALVFSGRHSRRTRDLVEAGKLELSQIKVLRRRWASKLNFLYQSLQVIRQGRRHDALVFGGGTQIFETAKNGVLPLLSQAVFTTALRRFFNKTVGHLYVGINKPQTALGAFLVRRILAASDFIVLRDRRSYDVCVALGTPAEKLFLAADTAYLRTPLERASAEDERQKIGVSLFPYFSIVARDPNEEEAFLVRAINAIAALSADEPRGSELVFFGSQPESGLDDIQYARKLADRIVNESGCGTARFVDYALDTDAMIAELGRMDCVVAMRLHILISASLAGVPKILALPYQEKVVEEAKALGLAIIQDGRPSSGLDVPTAGLPYRTRQCQQALKWLDIFLANN